MRPINKDHRKLRNAMTVADLISDLQDYHPDALVCFACDYGDYSHTQQCMPVQQADEVDRDEVLVESAYSQSGIAVERREDPDDTDLVDVPLVIILR